MRLEDFGPERRRFGYRRLLIHLRWDGIELKLFRLYKEERLTVLRRGGRKRALGTRAPIALPQGPNQRWSLDFVSDVLADGRRFQVLVVVDDFSRECLTLAVNISPSGRRVARELDRLIEARGKPLTVVSDSGPELTSYAVLANGTKSRRGSRSRMPSSRTSTAPTATWSEPLRTGAFGVRVLGVLIPGWEERSR